MLRSVIAGRACSHRKPCSFPPSVSRDPNLAGRCTNTGWRIGTKLIRFAFWLRGLPRSSFLQMGIEQECTPLHSAAHGGNLGATELLLASGADANSTKGVKRLTPLAFAAMMAHEPVVARLLDAGANPSIRDAYGRTPADWARKRGHVDLARLLDSLN